MSGRTNNDANRPVIVVDGRVLPPQAYRPSPFAALEGTLAWWSALSVLGGLLVVAGVLIGSNLGEATAIGGVTLFFGTAVCAGAERGEIATALGTAGLVWTGLGIAVVLGTDATPRGSLIGLGVCGGTMVGIGVVGAVRAGRRTIDHRRERAAL